MRNRIKVLSLVMFLLLGVMSYSRVYADVIDLDHEVSLEVHYFGENSEISIYKIADVDINAKMDICEKFENYPIDYENEKNWSGVATALQGYINSDGIHATKVLKTNSEGVCKFDDLDAGIYYMSAQSVVDAGYIYTAMPSIVSVPSVEEGIATYDVVANIKYEKEKEPEERINLSVNKIWEDKGYENKRPKEVEIALCKGNKLYDQQILNEKNGWTYTWENLDKKENWSVVEISNNSSYTVSVDKDSYSFMVTNTYKKDRDEGPIPTKPDIPQTGQQWIPVFILLVIGLGCLSAGLVLKFKGNKYEN